MIGNLRTIQLIEADLQLIMIIFITQKNSETFKKGSRISKYNFSSRQNYLIEEALLEKRLLYGISTKNRKQIVYTIKDFELYYNRQLANLISIILESISIGRKAIKLIMKITLAMTYYICIVYGISTSTYNSESERTARTQ